MEVGVSCCVTTLGVEGVAFMEKEGVQPLFLHLQSWFLRQAIEQNMSLRSFLRMTLRQNLHLSLSQIEELEEELKELETTLIANHGAVSEESSFSALLDSLCRKLGKVQVLSKSD